MSGYGVFVNSMGYHLKETSVGHLQVQGKLHLGNSNKTGYDISYSSGSGLLISPYTSTQYIVGPGYNRTITATTTAAATLTAAQVLGGLIIATGTGSYVLPTAANLLLALPHAIVGTSITFDVIINAAGTITIGASDLTNVGYTDLVAIANGHIRVVIYFTNVTTAAASFYVMGATVA